MAAETKVNPNLSAKATEALLNGGEAPESGGLMLATDYYSVGVTGVVASQYLDAIKVLAILAKALNDMAQDNAILNVKNLEGQRFAMIMSGVASFAASMLMALISIGATATAIKNMKAMKDLAKARQKAMEGFQMRRNDVHAKFDPKIAEKNRLLAGTNAPGLVTKQGVRPLGPARRPTAARAAQITREREQVIGNRDKELRKIDSEESTSMAKFDADQKVLETRATMLHGIVTTVQSLGPGVGQLGSQAAQGQASLYGGMQQLAKSMDDSTTGAEKGVWDAFLAVLRALDSVYAGRLAALRG